MATAALEVVKQEGYKMGLPSDDQAGQLNHNSEVVTAPQNMELEMQMSGQTPSSKVPPDVDQDGSLEAEANQKTEAPKKKTPGRKRKGESVARTPQQRDDSSLLDTAELTSSGRPKRRAAKIALDYLQNLAKEMTAPLESLNNATSKPEEEEEGGSPQKKKPRKEKGTKKKLARTSSDIDDDDEDFAPEKEQETEEEESEEEEEADLVVEKSFNVVRRGKRAGYSKCLLPNGLPSNIMEPIWNCFSRNKDFRDENFSPWVFPEWIPSANDWDSLSEREAEKYLPEEKVSSSFTFTREKVKEPIVLQTMNRFESMPYHPERWDSMFFVGGPVHSMEWCPCPDGAAKTQYAAIYCHKGMDDLHKVNQLYSSPALLQLWEVGSLQSKRPSTAPHLAYALAIDEGFIWNMKWCPSGTWELPSTCRKAPHMPRLGVIALSFSNGTIGVYSLPHPEALVKHHEKKREANRAPLICRAKKVLSLKMGANQADHQGQSGICYAMDWLYVKPHNILAAGFYDGSVGLWDLCSKSTLLRVKAPDGGVSLFPYHCFRAHDENIRSLCWCRASSHLLVTVGDDRLLKMWDVRKSYIPLFTIKRCLTPEVDWPLFWSGILAAHECCFSTFGKHGVHYFDSGYNKIKPYFVCPRKATVWSLSMSDWLNTFAMADNGGDCLFSCLPEMNVDPSTQRRRRFLVYRTDMVPFSHGQRTKAEEQQEEENILTRHKTDQTYRAASSKYYLHFHDMDLGNFSKWESRSIMKHMLQEELKGATKVDEMPLSALFKVRFNPNMDSYNWLLSAGQSGLVRVNCARGLSCSVMLKNLREAQAQFSSMFKSHDSDDSVTAVHHSRAETVQVQ